MASFMLRSIDPYLVAKKYLNGDFDIVKPTTIRKKSQNMYDFDDNKLIYHGINPNKKIECSWCREIIDKKVNGKKLKGEPQIMGIPYQSEFDYNNEITTYKTILFVDCYECAYALYLILALRNPGLFSKTESLILNMFSEDYPGKKLLPANDPWLSDRCGGPLNAKNFVKSKYIITPNRMLTHTTQEYILSDH